MLFAYETLLPAFDFFVLYKIKFSDKFLYLAF